MLERRDEATDVFLLGGKEDRDVINVEDRVDHQGVNNEYLLNVGVEGAHGGANECLCCFHGSVEAASYQIRHTGHLGGRGKVNRPNAEDDEVGWPS